MSLHQELDTAAMELRSAVERNDFAAAGAVAARYGTAARQAAAGLPPSEAGPLLASAHQEIEENRRKLCVARARIGNRLQRLRRAAAYRQTPELPRHTCNVSG